MSESSNKADWRLIIGALGVVFGDIGTSPLYALRECFSESTGLEVSMANVYGVLSLITWSLIIVISIKYVVFVLRADNRGEGGILALTALLIPRYRISNKFLISLGLFGTALLVGDGIITPAISVLSAVEGIKVANPAIEYFVVPIALGILVLLFLLQKVGTHRIGMWFGPVILVWFMTIGGIGLATIFTHPEVLFAISPHYAVEFLFQNVGNSLLILAAVFLAVTGGEALYADMGHFGRIPIQWAWWGVVLPGLLLNYFGQGALVLQNPATVSNPFYLMAPDWMLYPLVALATVSASIASQALISGVFSLARQAIQLNYFPRLTIKHTSSTEIGQIYLPQVNWALLAGVIYLVLQFQSSSALAGAYGLSVSATMVITTLLVAFYAMNSWGWSKLKSILILGPLILIDIAFVAANTLKIPEGGWLPLAIGFSVWTLMVTWNTGRRIMLKRLRHQSMTFTDLLEKIKRGEFARVPGTAVFMSGDTRFAPPAMIHNLRHNKILHEQIIILTVLTTETPTVTPTERVKIETIAPQFHRVRAYYGFMESPTIRNIVAHCRQMHLELNFDELTFFLGREIVVEGESKSIFIWQEFLYAFMNRNAQRATTFFKIPVDQVIEVGMQVKF